MARILIVEDEPRMQQEVLAALQPGGHELIPVANGLTGMARACIAPPDLIISDVVMPIMDGWTLLARIRDHSRLARTPFILLTSKSVIADLQRGFRLGADDYVPKPFDPRDLVERVDRLLTRGRGPDVADTSIPIGVGLSGSLEDISFNGLVSFLAIERKTGMVLVRSGRARARVFVRGGHIVSARLDHGPELRNMEAVFWLLRCSTGRFEFRAMAVEMADEVRAPTAFLVLESARRLDEERHRAASAS
jgi:DNA-binding response OmpR family regulator